MSIVVEDGTGLSNSESYCTVAFADNYHADRGNDAWENVDNKEAALRRATDYIEQVYGQNFIGSRVNGTQALSWPRNSVYCNGYVVASNSIPNPLINATAELAYKAAQGNLSPDLTQGIKREKIGAIEVEYDNYSVQYTRFRSVDNLLAPLMTVAAGGAFKAVQRV
jgi:hypothetical protein